MENTTYGRDYLTELKLYTEIYGNEDDAKEAIRACSNAYFRQAAIEARRAAV